MALCKPPKYKPITPPPRSDRRMVMFKPKRFFKIISSSRSNKLRIPSEFARMHGENLPDHVCLRVLSGTLWRVELARSGGDIWLQKGWKKFKDYYALAFGHFLSFEFDGDSQFDVVIYDMSATEIQESMIEETESESSSEEVSPNKKVKGKSKEDSIYQEQDEAFLQMLKNYDQKAKRKRTKEECPEVPEVRGTQTPKKTQHLGNKEKCPEVRGTQTPKKMQHLGNEGKPSVRQRAKAFEAKLPFENPTFILTLPPSSTSDSYLLTIPISIAIQILDDQRSKIKLRLVSDEVSKSGDEVSEWSVLSIYSNGHRKNRIVTGWKDFAQDNKLKDGDVCVFEVNHKNKLEWNVAVFRCRSRYS